MQRQGHEATDPLTGYSYNSEKTATKKSHKLLSRTSGPYAVQSATESFVTIDKDVVAIPVSLDRVTNMPRVPNNTEPTAGLHSTGAQSEPGMEKEQRGGKSFLGRLECLGARGVCH